jgi:hypothetical protein
MINLDLPVSHATPLLDYSIRHKHQLRVQREKIIEHHKKIDEYYDWKRSNFHNKIVSHRDYMENKDMELAKQKQIVENHNVYGTYQYMMYLGTHINIYI